MAEQEGSRPVENEHDSSFSDNSVSSDEEFKRDAHYRPLYRQDSEENSTFDEESSDDEADGNVRVIPNENGLYNHNIIAEWISTNEPLFDRAEYEARLRQVIDGPNPANDNDSDSDYDVPKENNANNNARNNAANNTQRSTNSNTNNKESSTNNVVNSANSASSSKDIAIGEDKSRTIMDIMSSFSLPNDNRPDWAKNIPEDEWKQHLQDKISPANQSNQQ